MEDNCKKKYGQKSNVFRHGLVLDTICQAQWQTMCLGAGKGGSVMAFPSQDLILLCNTMPCPVNGA